MDKINERVANIRLEISNDIPEEHVELLKKYWAYDGNFKLVNQPTKLRNELGMSQMDMTDFVKQYSSLSFYLLCDQCNSMEYKELKSQNQFGHLRSSIKKHGSSYICEHCVKQNYEKQVKKDRMRRDLANNKPCEALEQYNIAIDNKVWESLSEFQNEVLKNALQLNDMVKLKKLYFNKGMQCFKMLFKTLRELEEEKLVFLTTNEFDESRIENYQFLKRLGEKYDHVQKPNTTVDNSSTVQINNQTKELKFKLTVNKNQAHPDSPAYAGTVIFKEKIVIEPGEEYVFGLWNRSNDDLYLSMVPLESIGKLPIQKRLQSLPIPIRKGVEDFLNSIGKGLWLK